jgi:putative oxidoreductase
MGKAEAGVRGCGERGCGCRAGGLRIVLEDQRARSVAGNAGPFAGDDHVSDHEFVSDHVFVADHVLVPDHVFVADHVLVPDDLAPDHHCVGRWGFLLAGQTVDVAKWIGGSRVIKVPDRINRAYTASQEMKRSEAARDAALLVARVGLAWIFVYHGAVTLFGAFGGEGLHKASIFYGTVAHLHPATFFAVLGGIIEFFGGIAVGLGIFGRLAALGLVGDMAMAMATVTWANGMVSNRPGNGYELNLALASLAFVVAALGTGRLSLDFAIRTWWNRSHSGQPPGTGRESGAEVVQDGCADRVATP